jgi:hypothetical protein
MKYFFFFFLFSLLSRSDRAMQRRVNRLPHNMLLREKEHFF